MPLLQEFVPASKRGWISGASMSLLSAGPLVAGGRDGRIVYTGDRGPFGFNPDTWEEAIKAEIG
jgi:hypothetical protein